MSPVVWPSPSPQSSSSSSEVTWVMSPWSSRQSGPLQASTASPAHSESEIRRSLWLGGQRTIPRDAPGAGGRRSRTVATKLHDAWFCEPSAAVQVTAVSPSGSGCPESGQTAAPALQLSATSAVNAAVALPPWHSRICWPGQVSRGGVSSTTVTVAEQESMAAPSSAVSVTAQLPSPYGPAGACESASG